MKKTILKLVMLVIITTITQQAIAQTATASQLVKVHIEPSIYISAQTSSNVNINFYNVSNYVNGAESGAQQFKVQSNRDFVVNVKTDASAFTYSGTEYPTPQMPVNNTLFLAIADNQTGGSIANSFNSFKSLSSSPQDLLLNCKNGGDKTFAVNYKATPGTDYPAGDYIVGVVYTATQP